MTYISLILITLVIGLGAQAYVRAQLTKYSKISSSLGISGADAARAMLAAHGVANVAIHRGGPDQDFFDPRSNSITLDPDAYSGSSITAIATACHEVGHAIQYDRGYVPMKFRSALVPAVNLCSNSWMFILMFGIFLQLSGLIKLAIAFYAVAVLFQIVTLPVEFDASRRALTYLQTTGIAQTEQAGATSVLRACAFTYVAAALVSILQLLYLLGQQRD